MAIHKARYVKKGAGLTAVAGAQYWSQRVAVTKTVDKGSAGSPGRKASLVTYRDLVIRVYGSNVAALLALIGSAAEQLVVGYQDGAGANRKRTYKMIRFTTPVGTVDIKSKDAGGKTAVYCVEGHGCWLSTDTLALMRVDAADA